MKIVLRSISTDFLPWMNEIEMDGINTNKKNRGRSQW